VISIYQEKIEISELAEEASHENRGVEQGDLVSPIVGAKYYSEASGFSNSLEPYREWWAEIFINPTPFGVISGRTPRRA